jgi:PTH1 family peptidyl-tRNA hydrolase
VAERHGERLRRSKEQALVAEARIDGQRVVLAFPQTYVNESGMSVKALMRRHGIDDVRKVVVVHDELDLPVGRLQVKAGGGLAGHNGLKSIKAHLHSGAFTRIRIGIDKPAGRGQGIDHVLRAPGRSERTELAVSIEIAADAVEYILDHGVVAAQNRFNAADGAGE